MDIVNLIRGLRDRLTEHDLEVADRIESDAEAILDSVHALSLDDAAKLLGQSRQTIHHWLRLGFLDRDASSDGRRVFITGSSVVLILPVVIETRRSKRSRGRVLPELRRFFVSLEGDRQARIEAGRRRLQVRARRSEASATRSAAGAQRKRASSPEKTTAES